jgi:chorismate dehydratase
LSYSSSIPIVCAVNYLNTVPLVWGMLHGPQQSRVRLRFEIPSICAETVESGEAGIGLVPVAEVARQGLEIIPGYGIACRGAVRSILLVSRVPIRKIRTLAADLGSRTSVQLARVILREIYGVQPEFMRREPNLESMLAECDAALVIGDPALRIDPTKLAYETLDLGAEWQALTGLPMVFALWAGNAPLQSEELSDIVAGSYEFGRQNIYEVARQEHAARGVTESVAQEYLTSYIRYEIGDREMRGLETFVELAGLQRINVASVALS